jgi:hypothetical protein
MPDQFDLQEGALAFVCSQTCGRAEWSATVPRIISTLGVLTMKLSALCAALLALTGCATETSRGFNDPVMHGLWSRSTLFTLENITATRTDLVTVSMRLYDVDSGKEVGAPVLVAKAGETFRVSIASTEDNATPVPDGTRVTVEGRVQITNDNMGRRIAEYQLYGRDRTGRQHTASGSTKL